MGAVGIGMVLISAGVILLWIDEPFGAGVDSATLGIALLLIGAAGGLVAIAFWASGVRVARPRRRRHVPRRRWQS